MSVQYHAVNATRTYQILRTTIDFKGHHLLRKNDKVSYQQQEKFPYKDKIEIAINQKRRLKLLRKQIIYRTDPCVANCSLSSNIKITSYAS